MSREAVDVRTEGQCRYCIDRYPDRMLRVVDGLLMPHGRPVPPEQRGRDSVGVEPCPGSDSEPLP